MYSGVGKCCICGKEYTHYGNNPYPLTDDKNARCCKSCDSLYVSTARLMAGRPFDLETARKIEIHREFQVDIEQSMKEYAEEMGYRLHKVDKIYQAEDRDGNKVDINWTKILGLE